MTLVELKKEVQEHKEYLKLAVDTIENFSDNRSVMAEVPQLLTNLRISAQQLYYKCNLETSVEFMKERRDLNTVINTVKDLQFCILRNQITNVQNVVHGV